MKFHGLKIGNLFTSQKIVHVKNLYDKIIPGKAEGLYFYQVWIRKQQSSNAGGRFAKGKFQSWNTS